jgi:putative ABC transport system permease protein
MRLSHTLRGLLRVPAFTGLVIATLALGIAANTAIFSVIEAVLLKPLPFHDPDQLVDIDHEAPGVNVQRAGSAAFLYFTYREDGRSFQDVGMWRGDTFSVTGIGEPEEIRGMVVTDGVFPMLGVQPAVGRLFSRKEDSPEGPETVVLTYQYWQSRFGGARSAVGRRILLDGRPRDIIGVLPADFRFLDQKPSVVVPMRLDRSDTHLGQFNYSGIARLKPGVTVAQANADLSRLIPVSLTRFPPFPGYNAKMFEEAKLAVIVKPLSVRETGDIRTVLWVLMATVGVVLLIACANVANLMLVRADARQQELAIRAALGAGRGRIVRELLLESVVLGVAGGVIGLGLAYGALRILTALAPENLPRVDRIGIDATVLLFAIAVSIGSGLLFGIIPALRHAGLHLSAALRAGGRALSESRERRRARSTLVIVQIALALVLLVSSGLMIRTFQALRHVNPGFTGAEHLQTLRIFIPESQVKEPLGVLQAQQQIAERIAAIPGVSSVAMTTVLPMDGGGWHDPIFASDKVYAESQIPPVRLFKFVSPGLLKTMGNRLIAGRDFTWTDAVEKRPVALVSENLARELWQTPAAALGKRIRQDTKSTWREVVGVVGDEYTDGVNEKATATAYWPLMMAGFPVEDEINVRRSVAFVVRTPRAGSTALVTEIGRAVWSVNPNLPLAGVRTLQEIYDRSLATTSFTLVMLAIAGAMALLLGIAGIYGVISYSVSQRTREIGIRMALGARAQEVRTMFVRYGFRLAAVGIAFGLLFSALSARMMTSLLFNTSPLDPTTYLAVSLGLMAAAGLASYAPAARATAVDPAESLRAE